MKAALVQTIASDDLKQNLDTVLSLLEQASAQKADIAVLPELWNTPFELKAIERHKHESLHILDVLRKAAKRLHLWIISGTFPRQDLSSGNFFNQGFVIDSNGEIIDGFNKLHLLEVHTGKNDFYESRVFVPGSHFCLVPSPWGNLAVIVCMDIRYPELCRLLCQKADILIVCAGFNEHAGKKHWLPLLQARAIENEVFVLGVNPAAMDYGSYSSYGHSAAISPDGKILALADGACQMLPVDLSISQVEQIRQRSPYWKLRRSDLYSLQRILPADRQDAQTNVKSMNSIEEAEKN